MDNVVPQEQFPEIANILQCIAEGPKEADPVIRSEYFRVIQKQAEKILIKLETNPLPLK
jgi:hypothetical protein